jgi:hypothetical protein
MFLNDSKTVILLENDHQHDAKEEKENKIQGLTKNYLFRGLVYQNVDKWNRFMSTKAEIPTLSNDLRRNLLGKSFWS